MSTPNASSTTATATPNGSSATSTTATVDGTTSSSVLVPTKSSGDDRHYRYLVLPNGLQVLLVHDAETDKASAAMDVGVGCWSDPDELPGLAHFLEHMVSHALSTTASCAPSRGLQSLCSDSPTCSSLLYGMQLFLGTGKYPDESEYESFLNAHGQTPTQQVARRERK